MISGLRLWAKGWGCGLGLRPGIEGMKKQRKTWRLLHDSGLGLRSLDFVFKVVRLAFGIRVLDLDLKLEDCLAMKTSWIWAEGSGATTWVVADSGLGGKG